MPSTRVLVLCATLTALATSAPAARPVARWDVVPDQRFAGVFEAGVCAFHIDGVKVEFLYNVRGTECVSQGLFGVRLRNSAFANGVFQSMSGYAADGSAGLRVGDSHFVDPSRAPGANATTGDPGYVDAAARDFRLLPGSPARGTGIPLQCVPADIDGLHHPTGGRNRGAHADPPPPEGTSLSVSELPPAPMRGTAGA